VDDLQKKIAELEKQLGAAVTERDGLRKSLDDTTALAGEMKKRLEKLGPERRQANRREGRARAYP